SQLAFEALSIEGSLLSPEWLGRLAQLDAGQQSESDYRVPRGLNLRDEIGRYWRIAQAHWRDLETGRARGADPAALAVRFVTALLGDVLGFASLVASAPVEREGRVFPIGRVALGGRVPVVIAPAALGLDTPSALFGEGGRRRSAFGLVQEFLNAADEALWGIACDGLTLRLLRDNASLTRPAWVEADLARIFQEERYADFAALWLLLHETRFGRADQASAECPLEAWRIAGREQGTRARANLRRGVEEALLALGQGFVSHPDNVALRAALSDRALSPQDLFQQLFRLVYRLIFLLTAEERGVLHAPDAPDAARALYDEGYSLRRLRERSVRRSAHDRYGDLWAGLCIVFRAVGHGEARLGLTALGGLFAPAQCPDLDAAKVQNQALLRAVFQLSWMVEEGSLARVNWRDMGPEELGSVYESLLELVPQVALEQRRFSFATGDETRGNARKTSGSYYTPDSLVQVLLDSALEPVVAAAIAANPSDPVEALLSLSVVDPACGSGHFLLATARRLAAHVARLTANGTPSAAEYRHALRQVVGRCIYGVDLNPMALELCRVSLWMEAVEPGLALSFLDSHLQVGNALLGATPELMEKGIPDAAWEPIEGDDRKVASALKKRNKSEAKGQQGFEALWSKPAANEVDEVVHAVEALEKSPDADLEAVEKRAAQWEAIRASEAFRHQRFVADAWCAAFVWPKTGEGPVLDAAPTNGLWRQIRDGRGHAPALTTETVRALTVQYRFFHWHLAFPQVFKRGGFDVVLGNPPWERVKLQEQEFFASRNEAIAGATNAAARKRLIAALPQTDEGLWKAWCEASREAEGQSHFVRQSARFPLCGKGDVNTYPLFAEHNRALMGPLGRAGFIVPTGIATDEGTSAFLRAIVERRQFQQIVSFENEGTSFGNVNNRQSFCLLTISMSPVSKTRMIFNVNQPLPTDAGPLDFELSPDDFSLFNPNTANCPTFRTRRDAEINRGVYQRAGILWRTDDEKGNAWGLRFMRLFDMANDSGLFRSRAELEAAGWTLDRNHFRRGEEEMLPLFEAKMAHLFDHRFGTYEGATQAHYNKGFLPRFTDGDHQDRNRLVLPDSWVESKEVNARLEGRDARDWFLGWRDITRRTEMRTVVACIIPKAAIGHTMPLMFSDAAPALVAMLYANLCSFVLDYTARQKVGGAHLTYNYLKQLPVLPPSTYSAKAPWSLAMTLCDWMLPRVIELTYTAWDLEAFAADVGHHGPPFRWDPARRELLRAELDAAFFHLYGLSPGDVAYVMETFPIVKR
ncbi:MAG: SAM-dependent DNA methyltransferase, partial [Myxococcaceae bacterium]